MDSDDELSVYQITHESPSHWKLRKMFIKKYRNSLPEEELRCLSQVLLNIEFLGCVYPQETMTRVEALATEILKNFKMSQKDRIFKRTLVSAQQTTENKYRRVNDHEKKFAIPFVKATDIASNEIEEEIEIGSAEHRKYKKLLKNVVVFKVKDGTSDVNYANSTRKTIEQNKQGQWSESCEQNIYSCSYNGETLITVTGTTQKKARIAGYKKVYEILKNYCYTLNKKANFYSGDLAKVVKHENEQQKSVPIKSSDLNTKGKTLETYDDYKLGSDNIGFRMLKALGWKEGELSNKGIVDPIGLSVKIGRAGLGSELPLPKKGQKLNLEYFKKLLTNFRDSGTDFDLVFSSEFEKEERAQLHKLAQRIGLKSKSEGKDEKERFLTVRRKTSLSPIDIVNKIKAKDPFYSAIWEMEPPDMNDYEKLDV